MVLVISRGQQSWGWTVKGQMVWVNGLEQMVPGQTAPGQKVIDPLLQLLSPCKVNFLCTTSSSHLPLPSWSCRGFRYAEWWRPLSSQGRCSLDWLLTGGRYMRCGLWSVNGTSEGIGCICFKVCTILRALSWSISIEACKLGKGKNYWKQEEKIWWYQHTTASLPASQLK